MEWWTIAISIIALLVSISSFQWNKAQHNLNQLQANANKFCDNLQGFIEIGTTHHLTAYKYEIENIVHIQDEERYHLAYNDLQYEFSKRRDTCQKQYMALMESVDFFQTKRLFNDNELLQWLTITLNEYYLKLNQFHLDLFEINMIVRAAEEGLLSKKRIEFVHAFFDNIRDLLDYSLAFWVLKREIAGYFGKLSLMDVGLFGKTKSALMKIENNIMWLIKEYAFDEAIHQKDYTKIRNRCLDFGENLDDLIDEEETDFLKFLNSINDMKIKQENRNA